MIFPIFLIKLKNLMKKLNCKFFYTRKGVLMHPLEAKNVQKLVDSILCVQMCYLHWPFVCKIIFRVQVLLSRKIRAIELGEGQLFMNFY